MGGGHVRVSVCESDQVEEGKGTFEGREDVWEMLKRTMRSEVCLGGGGSRIASPFSAITVHVSHSSTGGCET